MRKVNNTFFFLFVQARIAKRDRKLVDYDSARHNYAVTHKTKKKDGGIKITKVNKCAAVFFSCMLLKVFVITQMQNSTIILFFSSLFR